MQRPITYHEIKKEIAIALKHIRQANKGLVWPVKINKDFSLFPNEYGLTLQIHYVDGDLKTQVYNIAIYFPHCQ